MKFPPFPKSHEEIRSFSGKGEYMACSIIHRTDMQQLMAYRRLRQRMGNRRFLDTLTEAIDILSRSESIYSPAGWLYAFLADEANAYQD